MRFIIFFLAVFLASCSSHEEEKAVNFSLLDSHVTANFSHAPLREVVKVIADQAHIVVRVSPSLTGEINASFDHLPMNQALDVIFKSYDVTLLHTNGDGKHVRELVLLDQNKNVNSAEIFVPQHKTGSLMSQMAQQNRQKHTVGAQAVIPAAQHDSAMKAKKALLVQQLNALQQQKQVMLAQKQDVSGLDVRMKGLQQEVSGVERNLRYSTKSSIYSRQQISQQRKSFL